MSLHRTNIALTHEQWRFIEKNHMSLTKVVKPYLDLLILKQKEGNRLSFEAESIPNTNHHANEEFVCH